MGAAPSAGGLRDLVTSGVGFWVRGRSLSFYLGLLKAQNHFSAPNQMVHKVAQSPRAKPKMHVKTDLNNPLRAPCNSIYFVKELTRLGSKSHCRESLHVQGRGRPTQHGCCALLQPPHFVLDILGENDKEELLGFSLGGCVLFRWFLVSNTRQCIVLEYFLFFCSYEKSL